VITWGVKKNKKSSPYIWAVKQPKKKEPCPKTNVNIRQTLGKAN
jgi:hypothetical protein